MTKFVAVLVLVAVVSVQGYTSITGINDDVIGAASAGDWDQVHKLLNTKLSLDDSWKPLSGGSVRELKPVPGGHVYGESQYTFQSSSNINGQKTEQSGGHKIINKDGEVSEFDFKPTIHYK